MVITDTDVSGKWWIRYFRLPRDDEKLRLNLDRLADWHQTELKLLVSQGGRTNGIVEA